MKKKLGRPRKKQEGFPNGKETQTEVETKGDVLNPDFQGQTITIPLSDLKPEPKRFVEKPEAPEAQRIAESRESLKQALGPDQKFFETPDGEIIIGEAEKNHVWSRRVNGGHGGWVNPRR
jgi:hypothetical protein